MNYAFFKSILAHAYLNTVERMRIALLDFENNPPVLIYQMGKVGSSTVYKSLKKSRLSNPVFHVHYLTNSGIKMAETFHKSNSAVPIIPHIRLSKILLNKLDKSPDINMKIITLIRDPIAFEVSNFFQNVKWLKPDLIDDNGQIDKDQASHFLENKIKQYNTKTGYVDTWFDNEIKVVCDIDVFDHSFDNNKGVCIIRKENVDLLIFRLEDLNRNFKIAITEFLSPKQPIEMIKANVGKNKKYSSDYQYIKDNIKIPESVCRKIYSSRFFMHFYTDTMREDFIKKWAWKNQNAA